MELFAKIVNGWNPLTTFAESFNLDVGLGSENASELCLNILNLKWAGDNFMVLNYINQFQEQRPVL